jgi:hypothetical protein
VDGGFPSGELLAPHRQAIREALLIFGIRPACDGEIIIAQKNTQINHLTGNGK